MGKNTELNGSLPVEFFTWYEFYIWVITECSEYENGQFIFMVDESQNISGGFTFEYIKKNWENEMKYLGGYKHES